MHTAPGDDLPRRAALLAAEAPCPTTGEAPEPTRRTLRGALGKLVDCCCTRVLRNLDSFLLQGQRMPTPLPALVVRQVRFMRFPTVVAAFAAIAALVLQYSCMCAGWDILGGGVPDSCGWLHLWLLAYCWVLTLFPFFAAFAGPVAVPYGVLGLLLRAHTANKECKEQSLKAYEFVDQFLHLGYATCGLTIVSVLILWLVKRKMNRLAQWYAPSGPADREVVRRILADARPQQAVADLECSICLVTGADEAQVEAGQAPRWLALRCDHVFHEQCLKDLLARDRRCPLCRLDLQAAYLQGASAEIGSQAS